MKTAITERLGIEFPILAFSHCRDVIAAVTNAGGFGVLGAVSHSPEQLEIDLDWIEAETNGKPYGVDLLIPQKFAGADDGGLDRSDIGQYLPAEHRAWLDGLLLEYGIEPLPSGEDPTSRMFGGMRVDPDSMAPLVDIAFAKNISLIASALGPPPAWLIERGKQTGVAVAALAGSLTHAQRHAAAGADIIIAQGGEAGGHTGEVGTMVLVPEVVDAVAPTPVVAAGGIGRGRQMAASLALGAEGVWCGSVWLTTHEAETAPVVKEKFLAATSQDTVRSRSLTGKPARMLKGEWTEAWERDDCPGTLPMPIQSFLVSEAQKRIGRVQHKDEGARRLSTYFVGQIVGAMNQPISSARVVLEMVEEFIDAMERLDQITKA